MKKHEEKAVVKVRRMMAWLVLELLITVGAFAVEGGEVALRGGTALGIAADSVGLMELGAPDALVFRAGGKELRMPYRAITSPTYSTEVARHLGFLPAIATGLVRKRERKHFVTLIYGDENGRAQMLLFEISKGMPREVMATLQARAPQACGKNGMGCRVSPEF